MIHFIRYDPANGRIFSRYSTSEDQARNYEYRVPIDDPDYPYEVSHRVDLFLKALVEKPGKITLTVDKPSIVANGTDEAVITVGGLIESGTVQLGSATVVVTPEDNTIHFTSDTAGKFTARFVMSDTQYSFDSVTIEAT